MDLNEKLRGYWHDVYFRMFPNDGVEFAMKCKDVTARIDLGEKPVGFIAVIRFKLHLSLCRACRRYFELSEALGHAIRSAIVSRPDPIAVARLNSALTDKYSKKPD